MNKKIKKDRLYSVIPGTHKILQLDPDLVAPLGGFGQLITPSSILVTEDEIIRFLHETDSLAPPPFGNVIDNSTIFFPLVPLLIGAAVVDNEANWGINKEEGIGAEDFHNRGIKGQGVRIGIADSGMDSEHPVFSELIAENRLVGFAHFNKLAKKIVQRRADNTIVPDAEATPTFGHWHGTHCAGILVGQATDDKDHGVAPKAELAVVRVLEHANEGSPAGVQSGLTWLTTQGCDIVSISLGQPGFHEVWWPPISTLLESGVVVVAAVGNEALTPGSPLSRSPANYLATLAGPDNGRLIPVGAHNQFGTVWDESGGEIVDWSDVRVTQVDGTTLPSVFATTPPRTVPSLVAPGVNIISASPPGDTFRSSAGSSMAAPHIAGLIALILSELRTKDAATKPNVAADLLLECLKDVPPPGVDARSGQGRVDNDVLSTKLAAIMDE